MKKVPTKGNSNQVGIIVDEVSSRTIHIQLGNEVIAGTTATTTAIITTVTMVVK